MADGDKGFECEIADAASYFFSFWVVILICSFFCCFGLLLLHQIINAEKGAVILLPFRYLWPCWAGFAGFVEYDVVVALF